MAKQGPKYPIIPPNDIMFCVDFPKALFQTNILTSDEKFVLVALYLQESLDLSLEEISKFSGLPVTTILKCISVLEDKLFITTEPCLENNSKIHFDFYDHDIYKGGWPDGIDPNNSIERTK